MAFRKITAYVRCEKLGDVEKALRRLGVRGYSTSEVKGCGEYVDFFNKSDLIRHARIEIFTTTEICQDIVNGILTSAHTGDRGDGIVAVQEVDDVHRVRTGRSFTESTG